MRLQRSCPPSYRLSSVFTNESFGLLEENYWELVVVFSKATLTITLTLTSTLTLTQTLTLRSPSIGISMGSTPLPWRYVRLHLELSVHSSQVVTPHYHISTTWVDQRMILWSTEFLLPHPQYAGVTLIFHPYLTHIIQSLNSRLLKQQPTLHPRLSLTSSLLIPHPYSLDPLPHLQPCLYNTKPDALGDLHLILL